jgi:hypothetical protein
MVYVDRARTITELEKNIRKESEAILVNVMRRIMGNLLPRGQECTRKDVRKNLDLITEKPFYL